MKHEIIIQCNNCFVCFFFLPLGLQSAWTDTCLVPKSHTLQGWPVHVSILCEWQSLELCKYNPGPDSILLMNKQMNE